MTRTFAPWLGALAALASPSLADAATLAANVAPWVARAPRIGAADDTQRVAIVVHMTVRDPAALKHLADAVATPGARQYGTYLSQSAFAARFAPAATDVAAVQAMLRQGGMTGLTTGPAGMYVAASASIAQVRATFGVSQDLYRVGTRTLRANAQPPHLPDALAGKVLFIEGLDDTTLLKHPLHQAATMGAPRAPVHAGAAPVVTPPPVAANAPSPYCDHYFGDLSATLSTKPNPYGGTLPWLACGYTPQQIQQAYGLNRVVPNGAGIVIAIVDAYASPTLQADGNQYAANHALPALTASNFSQNIPKGIYNVNPGDTCGPYGWWGEESLDLAAVHGSAPGATILYVGSRDCGTSLTTALMDTVYNHAADVITNSYGYNGEALPASAIAAQDQTFMAAATMGESVLFSSGDDGDLSQINGVASGSYSATSPYVTGVGGTSLGLRDAGGTKGEWGWGTYRDYLNSALVVSANAITTSGLAQTTVNGGTYSAFAFYSGAGGGISQIEAQPAYQASVVPPLLATTLHMADGTSTTLPTKQRVSPDISMDADPYTGYLIGESYTIAGDPILDSGCTPTTSTTEYCEISYGGTSLASPLMAGVIAIWDQQRVASGLPKVGFANPALYATKVGQSLYGAAVGDIGAPTHPVAVLRGYQSDLTRVRVVTVNSVPTLATTLTVCGGYICEGLNDVFNHTRPGYDDVTGLGVPHMPNLISQ